MSTLIDMKLLSGNKVFGVLDVLNYPEFKRFFSVLVPRPLKVFVPVLTFVCVVLVVIPTLIEINRTTYVAMTCFDVNNLIDA